MKTAEQLVELARSKLFTGEAKFASGLGDLVVFLDNDDGLRYRSQCIAEGKTGNPIKNGSQTHRCTKESGHDGAHEAKYEFRTVSWYGPAVKQEDDTRYRWGLGR